MCLRTNGKVHLAVSDKIVYKFGYPSNDDRNIVLAPIFNNHIYKFHEISTSSLKMEDDFTVRIGIHSFKSKFDAFKNMLLYNRYAQQELKLFRCVIPSGSYYYDGIMDGDKCKNYASDKIIFVNEINTNSLSLRLYNYYLTHKSAIDIVLRLWTIITIFFALIFIPYLIFNI